MNWSPSIKIAGDSGGIIRNVEGCQMAYISWALTREHVGISIDAGYPRLVVGFELPLLER
jgi:hypothetical protein